MKLKRMRETLFFFLDILLLSEHTDYIMKTENTGQDTINIHMWGDDEVAAKCSRKEEME